MIYCLGLRTVTWDGAGGQLCCQRSAYHSGFPNLDKFKQKRNHMCMCFKDMLAKLTSLEIIRVWKLNFFWGFFAHGTLCCPEVRAQAFLMVLTSGFKHPSALDNKTGKRMRISIMYSSFFVAGLQQYRGKERSSSSSCCSGLTLTSTNSRSGHLK